MPIRPNSSFEMQRLECFDKMKNDVRTKMMENRATKPIKFAMFLEITSKQKAETLAISKTDPQIATVT